MAEGSGQLKWWGNGYSVRVRFADGTRRWVALARGLGHAEAVQKAAEAAKLARVEPYDIVARRMAGDVIETVEQWAERWLASRMARNIESHGDDRSRFRTHILPFIGSEPMRLVTRARLEDLRDSLDARVQAGEIKWRTAHSAWAVARGMFRDASVGKRRELRVRPDNPCEGLATPDRGIKRAKQFLFPDEFLALVSHPVVPLRARVVYTLATYLLLRSSELQVLNWEDVDISRGHIHVHRALRPSTGEEKSTKTGGTRRFAMEPALLPLVGAIRQAEPDASRIVGRLFKPDRHQVSYELRAHLAAAGVRRAELFVEDETRKWITFHDLRATGITWMAVRGDGPLKIKQRAGHSTLSMTEHYVRVAEDLRDGFGLVFPQLPPEFVAAVMRLAPSLHEEREAAQ